MSYDTTPSTTVPPLVATRLTVVQHYCIALREYSFFLLSRTFYIKHFTSPHTLFFCTFFTLTLLATASEANFLQDEAIFGVEFEHINGVHLRVVAVSFGCLPPSRLKHGRLTC